MPVSFSLETSAYCGITLSSLLAQQLPVLSNTSRSYHNPGIYIVDVAERRLFAKWLSLPHPHIHIAGTLIWMQTSPATPELEAEVAAVITPEQEKRFSLIVCAEKLPLLWFLY